MDLFADFRSRSFLSFDVVQAIGLMIAERLFNSCKIVVNTSGLEKGVVGQRP
jgi:hypothetical protein